MWPRKTAGLAERYLEMILGQTERAVPVGTARSKSFFTGGAQRGTVMGELLQSGLQYKSFGLSFQALQWQALQQEIRGGSAAGIAASAGAIVARGAAYATSLAIPLTLGGALAIQLQSLVAGKSVQPMDNTKFWIAALQKGGGFGIMGDYLFADMSRFGHTALETALGPTAGLVADILDPVVRLGQRGAEGEKINPGRAAVQFMGRYTPMISTLPYTRAAYRRMFLDQLQYLLDPEAHKYFRQQEQQLRRDTHQQFWWHPGEMTPDRTPDLMPSR